jgi:hypothetical protein
MGLVKELNDDISKEETGFDEENDNRVF